MVENFSSSSPVVTPEGTVLYGALDGYTDRGHLLAFDHDGTYRGNYTFGWDTTPAIAGARIVLKDNWYFDPHNTEIKDPGPYYITALDASSLLPVWQFQSTETKTCVRAPDGSLTCTDDHPNGFEWCVNAPVVDRDGTVFANSEDGHVYAITADGQLRDRFFLDRSLGAAYTPLALDHAGRIYALNNGHLFVIGAN
jgi:outer membrane protein assembly factor BamB